MIRLSLHTIPIPSEEWNRTQTNNNRIINQNPKTGLKKHSNTAADSTGLRQFNFPTLLAITLVVWMWLFWVVKLNKANSFPCIEHPLHTEVEGSLWEDTELALRISMSPKNSLLQLLKVGLGNQEIAAVCTMVQVSILCFWLHLFLCAPQSWLCHPKPLLLQFCFQVPWVPWAA